MTTKTVTYENDDGEEIKIDLPAKNEVCDRCEGFGTHLTPSIGEHAYSREEFEEAFSDEENRAQYFQRGGIYDVTCEGCRGNKVVLVVDEEHVTKYGTEQEKEAMKAYFRRLDDDADYERECAAERRMGA